MARGESIKLLSFSLSPSDQIKFELWKIDQKKKSNNNTAIGGRWTFTFTPTGLGTVVSIKDNETNDILELTDYDSW